MSYYSFDLNESFQTRPIKGTPPGFHPYDKGEQKGRDDTLHVPLDGRRLLLVTELNNDSDDETEEEVDDLEDIVSRRTTDNAREEDDSQDV